MPIYTFFCESCKEKYEIVCSISSYSSETNCTLCGSKQTHRLYVEDACTQSVSVRKSDSELKTVGDLAKRNTDRMSNDEKEHLRKKHNSYKENKIDKPLPKGMSRLNRPKTKTKWT